MVVYSKMIEADATILFIKLMQGGVFVGVVLGLWFAIFAKR